MDTMTYVIVCGWVLMYFLPSFALAFIAASALAFLAGLLAYIGRTGAESFDWAGLMDSAMPVAPVTFIAIFMGWPLGLVFRRIRLWLRRRAAGV